MTTLTSRKRPIAAATVAANPVEQMRKMNSQERTRRIEAGQITFEGKKVYVNFACERIFCNKCHVIGNNLNVVGDKNNIYGTDNRANGVFNRFHTLEEWNELKKRQAPAPTAVGSVVRAAVRAMVSPAPIRVPALVAQSSTASSSVQASRPDESTAASVSAAPQSAIMPPIGQDPSLSPWKRVVGDLIGEPKPCTDGDAQCIICFENRFDVLFEPCHHLVACVECARKLQPEYGGLPLCPMCRKPIELSTLLYSA